MTLKEGSSTGAPRVDGSGGSTGAGRDPAEDEIRRPCGWLCGAPVLEPDGNDATSAHRVQFSIG